jgi:hypothetical protein
VSTLSSVEQPIPISREVQAISALVQSKEHRHMSIRALALHAQRVGEVLAHPATWGKLIRRHGPSELQQQRNWPCALVDSHPIVSATGLACTALSG